MAEALGLALNIAAIIQVAVQITQLSYGYARDVKNAPKAQKQYLQEVSALMDILFRVEQVIQDTELEGVLLPRPPSFTDKVVMNCYNSLLSLEIDLQKRRSRFLQPFHEREWKEHINTLHNYRSLFVDYLASCTSAMGNATYKKVFLVKQEQDRTLLLTWLGASTIPMRQRPTPHEGTGLWFLEHKAVQQWVDRTSPFVWCHGPPGVGKSHLTALLIDYLLYKRTSADCPVVYFFCDFSSQDQVKTVDILRHILRQLVEQGTGGMLEELKRSCKDPSQLQNAAELTQFIVNASSVQPMYLILDALDELKDPTGLLWHLESLQSPGIQVFLTSRDLPHIRKKMNLATHIPAESNVEDLMVYVKSRFQESDFSDMVNEQSTLVTEVVSKSGNLFLLTRLMLDDVLNLTTVNQIRKSLNKPQSSLQQAFKTTMERIDAQPKPRRLLARRLLGWIMYGKRPWRLDEILCAFAVEDDEELDPDNMPSADIILRACLGLVTVSSGDNILRLVHTTAYEFFKSNGDLFEKETNLDIARTSLQYLTMQHLGQGPCTDAAVLLQRFKSLVFLEYSSQYWGEHISDADTERLLETGIMKLLRHSHLRDSAFQALQFRQECTSESLAKELLHSIPTDQSPLHIAAYWNLSRTTKILIEAGESVSAKDSHEWTALHWACSKGHLEVAKVLIRNAANVNAQDIQGWTPLFWAALRGNQELVHCLLSHGANHLIKSKFGWTALHWAVSGGHSDAAKELLEHHSRSIFKKPTLWRMSIQEVMTYADTTLPLEMAAEGKDTEIFDLLVQHLEPPNSKFGDSNFNRIWSTEKFDSPVSRNAWRTMKKADMADSMGRREQFHHRIKRKDTTGNQSDWRSILLLSAIESQQLASVQLLIQAGADVNFENALHMAACVKDPRYVQCLLQNGAKPDEYNNRGRTALQEATIMGFLGTATALIDGGANVNKSVLDNRSAKRHGKVLPGATCIIMACGFLSDPELALNFARLLHSRGADPGLTNALGGNALHYAVLRPHLPLIQLLISAGCPVDVADQNGRLPIHLLADCQEELLETSAADEIVRVILEAGLTSTLQDMLNQPARDDKRSAEEAGTDCTPIVIALQKRRWKVAQAFHKMNARIPSTLDLNVILYAAVEDLAANAVDMLLDHGACPSDDIISALMGSVIPRLEKDNRDDHYSRFRHILGKLVAAGADINYHSSETDPALTRAARISNNLELVQELVSLGADVYCNSHQGFDPILSAAIWSDLESLRYLLKHATAHPNSDHWSRYLIDLPDGADDAIMRVCACLEKGDVLNRTNSEGRTILHLAAECGNTALIDALLRTGARVDIADGKGWYPVHLAGVTKHIAAVQALLQINDTIHNPLSQTTDEQDTKLFWLEVLNKPIERDSNILQLAVQNNNVELARYLLDYGMDPNASIKHWSGHHPVLYHTVRHGFEGLFDVLIAHDADTEAADASGWRPLHAACYYSHMQIVTKLIDRGCNIHAATHRWNDTSYKPSGLYAGNLWAGTPLHLAVMAGNADIVNLLLQNGADIYANTGISDQSYCYPAHGPTALHLALDTNTFYCRRGTALGEERLQIAQWLVDRGATITGVISKFSRDDILRFTRFSNLWDTLRLQELRANSDVQGESARD